MRHPGSCCWHSFGQNPLLARVSFCCRPGCKDVMFDAITAPDRQERFHGFPETDPRHWPKIKVTWAESGPGSKPAGVK